MKPFRFTPRRFFGCLLLGAFCCLALDQWVKPPDPRNRSGWVQRTHGWVRDNIASTILTPASAFFRWGQSRFERAEVDLAGDGSDGATPDGRALRDRIIEQERELRVLREALDDERARLRDIGKIRERPSLYEQKMIGVKINGFGTGAGDTITIDGGHSDGIRPGAIVLSKLSPIGRVLSVGEKVATVLLITDPARQMWMQARLVRKTGDIWQKIADPCQVHGIGNGMLRCESIDATRGQLPPAKGDLVQVNDPDWEIVKGTDLGEVVEVSRLENQNLRYDLKIKPAVSVSESPEVWVVIGP